MSKKKIVIFGLGDFAQVAYFYFKHDSDFEVVAFCVDAAHVVVEIFFDLPVRPFELIEQDYSSDEYAMFVAIGYSSLNEVRRQKYYEAKAKGYELVSYISSKATVWSNDIGDNCFILENQVIQPFTKIGNNVVLWSGNHIGHHSVIEDHCFVTSHVVVSGNVRVEQQCFIGVNATIRNGIVIGEKSIIGAGALIMRDVEAGSVYKPLATVRYACESKAINL